MEATEILNIILVGIVVFVSLFLLYPINKEPEQHNTMHERNIIGGFAASVLSPFIAGVAADAVSKV